jgi:hypothetical protein
MKYALIATVVLGASISPALAEESDDQAFMRIFDEVQREFNLVFSKCKLDVTQYLDEHPTSSSDYGERMSLCLQAAGWPKIPEHGSEFYAQAQDSLRRERERWIAEGKDVARFDRYVEEHPRWKGEEYLKWK